MVKVTKEQSCATAIQQPMQPKEKVVDAAYLMRVFVAGVCNWVDRHTHTGGLVTTALPF